MAPGVGFRLGFSTPMEIDKLVFSVELNVTFSEKPNSGTGCVFISFTPFSPLCFFSATLHACQKKQTLCDPFQQNTRLPSNSLLCFYWGNPSTCSCRAKYNLSLSSPESQCPGDQSEPRRKIKPSPGSTHLPYLFMRRTGLHWRECPRCHRGQNFIFSPCVCL